MTFYTGTVNDAFPATALMAALDSLITGHAAWEFVEEVVNGTDVSRVYKCLGSVNSWGTDFYVVMRRVSPTGNVGFELAEDYITGTDLLIRYAPADNASPGSGTYTTPAGDKSIGAVGQLPDAAVVGFAFISSTSTMDWWLSITNDRMCFAAKEQGFSYVGLYESFHASGIDPAPLVLLHAPIMNLMTGSTSEQYSRFNNYSPTTTLDESMGDATQQLVPYRGAYTRQLGSQTQSRNGFQPRLQHASAIPSSSTRGRQEALSGKYHASKVILSSAHYLNRLNLATERVVWRGLLRDVVVADIADSSPVNGDTLVISGANWRRMGNNSYRGQDFWVREAA